jgi:3-dehydro-L-gulonate 2-dehydrogenase
LRVSYQELFGALQRPLLKLGFEPRRAEICARLITETTCDGVYSHGLNRFPRFVRMIHNGCIDVQAQPVLLISSGPLERWDGQFGAGNVNAHQSMERAILLARQHGSAA